MPAGLGPSAETRAPKTKNESAEIDKEGLKRFFRPNLTLHFWHSGKRSFSALISALWTSLVPATTFTSRLKIDKLNVLKNK